MFVLFVFRTMKWNDHIYELHCVFVVSFWSNPTCYEICTSVCKYTKKYCQKIRKLYLHMRAVMKAWIIDESVYFPKTRTTKYEHRDEFILVQELNVTYWSKLERREMDKPTRNKISISGTHRWYTSPKETLQTRNKTLI